MYKGINNYIHTITTTMPYGSNIRLFRKAILIFLLCNTLFLLSYSETLYGTNSYFLPFEKYNNIVLDFLNILENPRLAAYWKYFVAGQIISIVACLFLPYKRLFTFFVYFFTMNLYHKTIPIQNAGFNLLVMTLFLLILFLENIKYYGYQFCCLGLQISGNYFVCSSYLF
jgi:hypothetical protein